MSRHSFCRIYQGSSGSDLVSGLHCGIIAVRSSHLHATTMMSAPYGTAEHSEPSKLHHRNKAYAAMCILMCCRTKPVSCKDLMVSYGKSVYFFCCVCFFAAGARRSFFLLRVRGAIFSAAGARHVFFSAGARRVFLGCACVWRGLLSAVFCCGHARGVVFLLTFAVGAGRVCFCCGCGARFFFCCGCAARFFCLRVRGALFSVLLARGAFFFCCGYTTARFLLRVRSAFFFV